ncbi:MAG: phage tail protein [Saprospiraceae bacterium]
MADYPQPKFHFSVEFGGASAAFTEVTGLDHQIEVIEYRHGLSPVFSKTKQPGLTKFSNIVLKRGTFQSDTDFYKWLKTIQMNKVERRDVVIKLLNENHEPVLSWKVINSFPIKVQASDLKSDANEAAIETLELAHEGLSLIE